MQRANTPPGRKSISASGTEQPSGLNQRLMCSALLHALNTRSRGAGNVREITSGLGLVPDLISFARAIAASLVFQVFEIGAQPIEPALPLGTAGIDPLFREAQCAGFDPAHP